MKKNIFLRVLALALAVLMLVPALIACNDSGDDPAPGTTTVGGNNDPKPDGGTTTGDGTTIITPSVETNEFGVEIIDPNLPVEDYAGRDFVVHTRGNVEQYEWEAEKITGEELNDAIFERNEAIMDKYNINIVVQAEGTWSDYANKTLVTMKTNIKANTGAYDLIAGYSTPISTLVTTGLLYDLNEFDYIDFDQPWWSSNFAEEITIADKTFFGVGSLSLSMIYSMMCIIFNKDLLAMIKEEDGSAINIYDVVLSGEWTWDKMIQYCNDIYLDDGDGIVEKTDRYGLSLGDGNHINSFLIASGLNITSRDNDTGDLIIDVDATYADKVLTKLIDIRVNTPSVYNGDLGGGETTWSDFTNGNYLFHHHWLYWVQTQISKVMTNYGIIPMPKFNAEQKDYCTGVQSGMHMYCIPIDVKDAEANSIITEALACESYHELVPKYFQICLKSRYSPDAEDARCIDILYNTVTFDIAYTFSSSIGIIPSIGNMVKTNIPAFGRLYTAQQATFQKKIDDLIDGVENPVA